MFLCVMSRNEFAVESCMNCEMMSGCIFQFVMRHLKNESMISNHAVMLFCFFSNNVQYMFYQASSFNSDISSWNTSKVTDMEVS